MRKFDYSFLDNGLIPANIINITSVIYSLKTREEIRKENPNNRKWEKFKIYKKINKKEPN